MNALSTIIPTVVVICTVIAVVAVWCMLGANSHRHPSTGAGADGPACSGNRPSSTARRSSSPAEERPFPTPVVRTLKYRTADGSLDYTFAFVSTIHGWRIYIVDQPPYGSRPNSCHATHRLFDGNHHYVCWSAPITTFDDATTVAARWAECTEEYRKTGRQF